MTEPTNHESITRQTEPVANDATAERLRALQTSRSSTRPTAAPERSARSKSTGPKPSRIVAAAASVSAGIGLVALMAGAQQEIVVQVNPAPVSVQPASIIVEMTAPAGQPGSEVLADVEVRVVEPATPVEQPVPQARVVSQSEGS